MNVRDVVSSGLVPEVLEEYGQMTRVALCEYLESREPRRHLYSMVADYPERGGRMLRPSLLLATAQAFGGDPQDAVHAAAAIELFHNAFLVHDDVEDESDTRRGRPTLNAQYGVPLAVNAGDALAFLGIRATLAGRKKLGPRLALDLIAEVEQMARESIEGQAIEIGWRKDNVSHLTRADYLQMVLKKTCWYTTIAPLRIGALIATRGGVDPAGLLHFGFFLGAAFQVRDDLLNLEGDEARYGKELGGDILEGKRTVMLIELLQRADRSEKRRILAFLGLPRLDRSPDEAAWIRERMDSYDCLHEARQCAHALAGAAMAEFEKAFREIPRSRDRDFIGALGTWVLERK